MEHGNERPTMRSWRVIAQEIATETNRTRVVELSHELSEAFELQYSPRASQHDETDKSKRNH